MNKDLPDSFIERQTIIDDNLLSSMESIRDLAKKGLWNEVIDLRERVYSKFDMGRFWSQAMETGTSQTGEKVPGMCGKSASELRGLEFN